MVITLNCKIYPTKYQEKILKQNSLEYIRAVNQLIHTEYQNNEWKTFTSKDVHADISGNLRDSVKQDMKSILAKYNRELKKHKNPTLPTLKKPVLKWSYVGYTIRDNRILRLQCWDKKAIKVLMKTDISQQQYDVINSGKIGGLRITKKNNKWIAQIAVTISDSKPNDSNYVMGVDVGIKVPAVAVTDTGKTKFFGNGRMNKYYRRKIMVYKRRLGKAKKQKAINKIKNKEKRWMTYQDHCISKSIVDFAIQNNISQINMEKLSGIRQTTSKSRKNVKYIHKWSFYRLQSFIEYKANRVGIKVVYVNPKYTSQICPCCGHLNKAEDRLYTCEACGYNTHRDRVGAINIMRVSAIDGNSLSA